MMGQGMGEIGSFVGWNPTLSVGDIEEEDGRWGRKWENAKHFYEGNGVEDGR